MARERWNRDRLVEEMKQRLGREAWPRAEMSLILMLAGAAGFFSSTLLLAAGLAEMWLRYPLAVAAGYVVFLALVRVWIALRSPRAWRGVDVSGGDLVDGSLDVVDILPRGGASGRGAPDRLSFGGGGDFGGGGATDCWTGAAVAASGHDRGASTGVASGGSSGGGGFSIDVDGEELLAVVVAVVLVLGAVVACAYVVYAAPALLAEVLVDSLLVAGFYKRLTQERGGSWIWTAVRSTWVPTLAVALLLGAAGWVLQSAFPEAKSVGGVVRSLLSDEPAGAPR